MTVTVWGEAGGPDTLAAKYDRWGQLTEAHTYRDLELGLPAEGIKVDCDHDGRPVGSLIYAELGRDNRLRAVCVLDNNGLEQVEDNVFFSPMIDMRGNGIDRTDHYVARTAELIGLSVTFQTARLGAHPVSWRQGDVRNDSDRRSWPCSWRSSDPLLERAVDHIGNDWKVRTRSATRIIDQRPRDDYPYQHRAGERVKPGELSSRVLPNGVWKSGHVGKILSVR